MKTLLLALRCAGLLALTALYLAALFNWYRIGFPKPRIVDASPYLVQLLCFTYIWFAFSAQNVLLWVLGWLVFFPFATAMAHVYVDAIGYQVDFPGFSNFPSVFVLQFMLTALVCIASLLVFHGVQLLRGKKVNILN